MIAAKRLGILVVGLILAGLAMAIGYGYYAYEEKIMRATQVRLPPLPQIPPVPPDAMDKMDRLQPRLARLAIPTETLERRVNLRLFGYQPVVREAGLDRPASASPTADEFPEHVVSMAFVSPRLAFCVVDGRLRRTGEHMDNGTRIVRIAPGRVLLEWEGIEEWFEVSNPPAETEAVTS